MDLRRADIKQQNKIVNRLTLFSDMSTNNDGNKKTNLFE